jgi:acyl-CoA synthetase (AMP-forming)/AMP-acid ligase II
MLGYLDAPGLTAAAFDDGFFRSGDLARMRADGLVELVGRRKDIISRGGVKIAPLELDLLFAGHPDVDAALCGSVPDERLGEAVHVLVVRRKGAQIEAQQLKDWAGERVERAKVPDAIHFVDELPVGGTGKADRGAIAALVSARRR